MDIFCCAQRINAVHLLVLINLGGPMNQDEKFRKELNKHVIDWVQIASLLACSGIGAILIPLIFIAAVIDVLIFERLVKISDEDCQTLVELTAYSENSEMIKRYFCEKKYLTRKDMRSILNEFESKVITNNHLRTLEVMGCKKL